MSNVVAGHFPPPGANGVVKLIPLDIHPASYDDGIRRYFALVIATLVFQNQLIVHFGFFLLPRLRQPAVDKIHQQLRIILGAQKLISHIAKAHPRGIDGVDMEGHFTAVVCLALCPPLSCGQHLRLMPVLNDTMTLLAYIMGDVCWPLNSSPFDLIKGQRLIMAAMWAGHIIAPQLISTLHSPPNVSQAACRC